jgi:branched-chain amino acid transport system permease protein
VKRLLGGVPWPGILILAVLVFALPVVLPPFGVSVATEIFILAIFAVSLGLIIGYAGLVSLGHAAFFGAGAYTVALLGERIANTYVLLVAAVLVGGLLALFSGALFVRTSGAYFLMLTLAFAQVLFAVAFEARFITGGGDGLSVAVVPDFGFGEVTGDYGLYYMMAAFFLCCYLVLRLFVASPAGKAVRGVMENESRMRALGFNTRSYKLLAYALSGAIASLAGALYAYFNFFVTPDLLGWVFSGQALIMVIVGGVGSLLGPAIGAGFFLLMQEYLSSYTERWQLVMGLIFVAFVLVGRGGVFDLLALAFHKVVPRRIRQEIGGEDPSPPEPVTNQKEKAL